MSHCRVDITKFSECPQDFITSPFRLQVTLTHHGRLCVTEPTRLATPPHAVWLLGWLDSGRPHCFRGFWEETNDTNGNFSWLKSCLQSTSGWCHVPTLSALWFSIHGIGSWPYFAGTCGKEDLRSGWGRILCWCSNWLGMHQECTHLCLVKW